MKKPNNQPEERINMPAGEYGICGKCGRGTVWPNTVCDFCDPVGVYPAASYNIYGNKVNTHSDLPKKESNTILNTFKENVRRNVNAITDILGEPPVSDVEFDNFWKVYINNQYMKNENLDDIYNEIFGTCPKPKENIKKIRKETLDETFDKFFNESEIKVSKHQSKEIQKMKNFVDEIEESNDLNSLADSLQNIPKVSQTLVVNLFAGPGAGKSTTAAGIFFELKSRGINCELVTEFVKDLVWEERHKAINNQVYIFGKQHHRINRLLGQVEVIITDAPLLLTHVYDAEVNCPLRLLATREHLKHNSYNVFVKRLKEFNPKGRLQDYNEARNLDVRISTMLDSLNVKYDVCFGTPEGKDIIVKKILNLLKK